MKKLILFLILFFCFTLKNNFSSAQIPTYNLTVKNFHFTAPDSLKFDIYLLHTNHPARFSYLMGQYYLYFNPDFGNGGSLTFSILETEMDSLCIPRNPTVTNGMLRLFTNIIPGPGTGCEISHNGNGTLLGRFLLTTTTNFLPLDSFRLRWRNIAHGNPYTKLFALEGNTSYEITDSSGHSVDYTTSISGSSIESQPENFILHQNYPNPFNPKTIINYELPPTQKGNTANFISLKIYDISGREVATLVNQNQNGGRYSVQWDAGGLGSGMYVCKLKAGEYEETIRLVLLK